MTYGELEPGHLLASLFDGWANLVVSITKHADVTEIGWLVTPGCRVVHCGHDPLGRIRTEQVMVFT